MEYRRLGASGLRVSIAGLGCNNFGMRLDRAETERVVHAALDAGITFFDTADIYGGTDSETFLGAALKGRREDVIVATKFGMPLGDGPYQSGGSRHYLHHAVEASLKRLGTDYIDLYQMHQPDPSTPMEETLEALDDLVHRGLVRYLGSSNFAGWQIAEADGIARAGGLQRMVASQSEWSLLRRGVEREILPACEHLGIGMLPYFPLASGFLTGKYRRGAPLPEGTRLEGWAQAAPDRVRAMTSDGQFDLLEALTGFAAERGHTILELAIGWLASHAVTASVIAGATRPEQITANVAASNGWRLDADEMTAIDAILRGGGASDS